MTQKYKFSLRDCNRYRVLYDTAVDYIENDNKRNFFFDKKEYTLAEKALSMAMYSIVKGYGILGENDKIKELYKQFRLMYRKLVFKNTSMKFKYKCGIFALNKQIFIKLKK